MSNDGDLDKGGIAEEALRRYFINLGSFVVRGVPLREGGELVSDIDLWIYTRVSAYARQISIVDIKNKKRARGFERILWVRGLQAAVEADEAIIATSDNRESLTPFANRLGVRVLTSQPLRAITSRYTDYDDRISSEEVYNLWRKTKIGGGEAIQSRIELSLSRLAQPISFAALNTWLDDAVMYLGSALEIEPSPGPYSRAAYFSMALAAVAADYLGRELAFAEVEARRSRFEQGLLFGGSQASLGRDMFEFTEAAVTEFLDPTGSSASTIRKGLEDKINTLPVGGLVDFFVRPSAGKELLDGAIALEAAAFSRNVPYPRDLKTGAKAIIGAVSDYGKLSRSALLGNRQSSLFDDRNSESPPDFNATYDDADLKKSGHTGKENGMSVTKKRLNKNRT